jgi:hypothetical protein
MYPDKLRLMLDVCKVTIASISLIISSVTLYIVQKQNKKVEYETTIKNGRENIITVGSRECTNRLSR